MQQYPQNTSQQFGQQSAYPQHTQQQFRQQSPYPQGVAPSGQQFPYPQNAPQRQPGQRYQYNFTNKQMRRYFYKPPKTYTWLLVIGVVMLLFGIPASKLPGGGSFFIVVGLGLSITGLTLLKPSQMRLDSGVQYRLE